MTFDYVLVGGGLQNGLLALALADRRAKVALVERAPRLGGEHTWSFHAGDLPPTLAPKVEPMVVASWDGYDVAFPGFTRHVPERYASITSDRLHEVVRALPLELHLATEVAEIAPGEVTLRDGRALRGSVVIDARGPSRAEPADGTGWQKFVGVEVAVSPGCAPPYPMLMDAAVEQLDGFRFLYVLPLAPDRVLVEDTIYSDTPDLDDAAIANRAVEYAVAKHLRPTQILRRERGVLPIPWRAVDDADVLTGEPGAYLLRAGWRGGWFHPMTGYSLPVAARLAAFVAARAPERLADGFAAHLAAHRRQCRFARLLARMLFRNVKAPDRRNLLERFYRLPVATIRRFYALEPSAADKARILCGRPPRGFRLRAPAAQEA
jgi:lycopene beta-cyclase